MWVNDAVRVITGLLMGGPSQHVLAWRRGCRPWQLLALAGPGPDTAHSRGRGGQAATYVLSAAAQRSALAYWTPPRMAAASAAVAARPTRAGAAPDVQAGLIAPAGHADGGQVHRGLRRWRALFYTTGSKKHFCTASVIDPAARDVVLTAAHCVYSTSYATHVAYVRSYHEDPAPGTWAVRAITVAARLAHRAQSQPGLRVPRRGTTERQARASGHGRPRPRPQPRLRAGHRGRRLQRQRRPSGPVPDEEL